MEAEVRKTRHGYYQSLKVDKDLVWVTLVEKKSLDTYVLHTNTHTKVCFFFFFTNMNSLEIQTTQPSVILWGLKL